MGGKKWAVITAGGLWGTYSTEEEAWDVHDRFYCGAAYVLTPDEVPDDWPDPLPAVNEGE